MRRGGGKNPRPANTYRAARRNAKRTNRGPKVKNERTISRYIERKE